MTIQFKCPHCSKSIKAKDHLAGKRAPCPACKKPIKIPAGAAAPVDVEAMAAAAFSDAPAPVTAKVETKVSFNCPHCEAAVQVGAELAGKQAPCPECRRIVKVPQLVKSDPKDWRQAPRGPSGARRDTGPVPEGAWGTSVTSSRVSEDALVEAGALVEVSEPWTLKQKVVRGGAVASVAGLVLIVVWAGLLLRGQSSQKHALEGALAAIGKLGPDRDGSLHVAAGEYFLRTGDRDCVLKAREHFNNGRALLKKANSLDRDLLLSDLALLQLDMGGDGEDVIKGMRIKRDDAQKEAERILQDIGAAEVQVDALRGVVRKLIAMGQDRRVVPLASHVSSSETAPEMMAVAGLEMLRAGKNSAAEGLMKEALQRMPAPGRKQPPSKMPKEDTKDARPDPEWLPLPAPLAALCVALEKPQEIPESKRDRAWTIGQAEGLARLGDLAGARRVAASLTIPNEQFQALLGVAAVVLDKDPADTTDLDTAISLVEGPLQGMAPPVLLRQLMRLGMRANQAERMANLARALRDPDVSAWCQMDVLRLKLAGLPGRADDSLTESVPTDKLAGALALEALARHNARVEGRVPSVISNWDEKSRPFGQIGAVLGMQDAGR